MTSINMEEIREKLDNCTVNNEDELSEERVEQLNLKSRVIGKSVLDIGSNTGFILLSLAKEINKGIGVELNPYLVKTGKEVQFSRPLLSTSTHTHNKKTKKFLL